MPFSTSYLRLALAHARNSRVKKGQVDYFVLLLGSLISKVEFGHVLLVSLATFSQ